MVDITTHVSPAVQAYNKEHPTAKIRILGKCEFQHRGMSHKDRIATQILNAARQEGKLTSTTANTKKTILVASSGNTGCSVAQVGSTMGHPVIVITNAKCSKEKRAHMRVCGATVWMAEELPSVFPEVLGNETNYMRQEQLLANAFPEKYYRVNQYGNPHNTRAHCESTGPEIFEQTDGRITHFVTCASTGGTIMGVGTYLKRVQPEVSIVLADPDKSLLAGFLAERDNEEEGRRLLGTIRTLISEEGKTQVEGAGKTILTGLMRDDAGRILSPVDRAVRITDQEAFEMCRYLARKTGILVGGSSGVNVCAAKVLAEECVRSQTSATIVTLLCDSGIKYLSKIFT